MFSSTTRLCCLNKDLGIKNLKASLKREVSKLDMSQEEDTRSRETEMKSENEELKETKGLGEEIPSEIPTSAGCHIEKVWAFSLYSSKRPREKKT